MGQKNKLVLSLLIAVVMVAAVLASFGLNLFNGSTPEVVLPPATSTGNPEDPGPTGSGGSFFVPVDVTADTVQSIIETLDRPFNYARTVTIQTSLGGEEIATDTAQVWVDGSPDELWPRWTKTDLTKPTGLVQHTIVEETALGTGTLYLWFNGEREHHSYPADQWSADIAQRIPTYEDVLALDKSTITDTGYEEKEGTLCVYVEVEEPELGYLQRYWVSVWDGLLMAAETLQDGQAVLRVSASGMESTEGTEFALPDGTVLHRASG